MRTERCNACGREIRSGVYTDSPAFTGAHRYDIVFCDRDCFAAWIRDNAEWLADRVAERLTADMIDAVC